MAFIHENLMPKRGPELSVEEIFPSEHDMHDIEVSGRVHPTIITALRRALVEALENENE